jgi:hypothetical protein
MPLAFLLASALLLPACEKTPAQWMATARTAAEEGRHADALRAYEKALSNGGAHTAEAELGKARSLYALKQWQACARAALASTAQQDPVAARPARVLALQALAQAGDKAEAAKVLALLGSDAASDPAVAAALTALGLAAPGGGAATPGGQASGQRGTKRRADLARINAIQVDIGGVTEIVGEPPRADFPVRTSFQDPRQVVKVPSPDGHASVWRALDEGKGYYLWLSRDGGTPKRLDKCKNGYQPVWSPDSRRILYSAMDWKLQERNLFIYDPAKDSVTRAFNARHKVGPLASWSPDGSKIVYTYFDDLWIMNADGNGRSLLNLSARIKAPVKDAALFAWSADGSRLAYSPRGEAKTYLLDLVTKY